MYTDRACGWVQKSNQYRPGPRAGQGAEQHQSAYDGGPADGRVQAEPVVAAAAARAARPAKAAHPPRVTSRWAGEANQV